MDLRAFGYIQPISSLASLIPIVIFKFKNIHRRMNDTGGIYRCNATIPSRDQKIKRQKRSLPSGLKTGQSRRREKQWIEIYSHLNWEKQKKQLFSVFMRRLSRPKLFIVSWLPWRTVCCPLVRFCDRKIASTRMAWMKWWNQIRTYVCFEWKIFRNIKI